MQENIYGKYHFENFTHMYSNYLQTMTRACACTIQIDNTVPREIDCTVKITQEFIILIKEIKILKERENKFKKKQVVKKWEVLCNYR